MNHPLSDAGIPLLTEIIAPASPSVLTPQADANEVPQSNQILETTEALHTVPDPGRSHLPASPVIDGKSGSPTDFPDWDRLEREIRERITTRLHAKIDMVVEQRMEESLADLMQIAVESITSEVRQSLRQAISDTVSQAVTAEIALLKEIK